MTRCFAVGEQMSWELGSRSHSWDDPQEGHGTREVQDLHHPRLERRAAIAGQK